MPLDSDLSFEFYFCLFNWFLTSSTPLFCCHLKCDSYNGWILFLTFSICIVLKYCPPSGSCSGLWIFMNWLPSHISKITSSYIFSWPLCHLFTSISMSRATDQSWDTPFRTQCSFSSGCVLGGSSDDDDDDDDGRSIANVYWALTLCQKLFWAYITWITLLNSYNSFQTFWPTESDRFLICYVFHQSRKKLRFKDLKWPV